MDEKATIQWFKTASKLAKTWAQSMSYKSVVKVDEDDVRDFLVDLWFGRGGLGAEFEEQNRGQLYAYALSNLGRSRDVLKHAGSVSDVRPGGCGHDDEVDEDRLAFFSYPDEDGGADDDPLAKIERARTSDELGDRIEELDAIRDEGLSGALAEIFGTSDRRGRSFAADARSDKVLSLVVDAAKSRGLNPSEMKNLAAEIASERRRSIARANTIGDRDYSEIEAFEQMMGLRQPHAPTSTPEKTRSRPAKQRRKSVPPIPMQQQSILMQLELV